MLPERRTRERRTGERRSASASIDVSRIEHENLLKQVELNLRAIRRLEAELRQLRARLDVLTGTEPKR